MSNNLINLFKENQVRAAARAEIQGTRDYISTQAAINIIEGKLELFQQKLEDSECETKKRVYAMRISRLKNELYQLSLWI